MSFLSKLTIDNDEMNVLDCTFEFTQGTDYTGRPAEKPKGGQISILIESTSKTNFLEWMISDTMTKSGFITFFKRDNLSNLKKVVFKDAYCVSYKEHFNAESSQPMQTYLIISAKEIEIRGTKFENKWPSKN